MKRKSDVLLQQLHHYPPFNQLSRSAMYRAEEAMRCFKLHHGEKLTLQGSNGQDYFYLLQGTATIRKEDRQENLVAEEQKGKIHFFPRGGALEISALGTIIACHVASEEMDRLVAWDQLARESGIFQNPQEEASLRGIRETKAFRNLPFEAVFEAMRRMQRKTVATGVNVVTQGEPGDAFYLILEGKLEVLRRGINDDHQKHVATLGPGDAFGEEALILKGSRNATVRTITPATLLWLGKNDFDELVATPMIQTVRPQVARAMIDNGHMILDVRYEEEYEEAYIPGSLLIPLPDLRRRMNELDPQGRFLVICAAGKRAAVGALLLRQNRFKDAVVIEGGLRDWPFEVRSDW
ncbi:MAG: cyclic nucleotide-binding domain-containing protein [Magnetococcales bacterium]|nr:cyclic nucleotide-binding domain-containing protein [Magnetococcales bacterium]